MCDPTLLVGAQIVGGGMSAIGAYGQAASQRSSLNYDARIADLNAVMAERQAQIAMERGQVQVNNVRRAGAATKGTARATMAARGLDLTTGSPADVLVSNDLMTELDAQQAEVNAVREAWGYRTQAQNQRNAANVGRSNARAINPGMAAATSLLGSATSVGTSIYNFNKAGAWG